MSFSFKKGAASQPSKAFNFGGGGVDDPLAGVEYSQKLDVDAAREMTALQEGFAKRAKAEKDRFVKATDTEYWFAVCFNSRDDKEAFLKAVKANKNVMGDKYLDGYKLARLLGVEMG